MKIDIKDYQIKQGTILRLKKHPNEIDPFFKSKKDYRKILDNQIEQMKDLQELLYAHNRYALLIIFQAMDAAGKDSAINHVMSGVNPQGCQVFCFKQPSAEELDHDFLWRTSKRLPERGRIGIFNRSYYEEVLVVKVHPEILKHQSLPEELVNQKKIWKQRYESINNLEKHLYLNGTRVIKFFLNVSKDEQRKRFLDRIDRPEKNWKFSFADIEERKHWDDYMNAYEKCISATSTKEAPGYVIPADDKKNARLIVSEVIVKTLKNLKMHFPEVSEQKKEELLDIRSALEK